MKSKRNTNGMDPAARTSTVAALGLLTILLSACTTTSGGRGGNIAKSTGETIVQQQGRSEPVVSRHPARYWLDMRQAKGVLPRIDGALATGEAQAAVDLARGHLAKNPNDTRALTTLAAALVMARNYELAAYYASLVERNEPGNAAALNIRGMAAMLTPKARMADFQKAAALFQQSFDADPTQVAAGLNLGSLSLELGNARAAADVFARTAERCDGCTAARMGLGLALSRTGQAAKAVEAFKGVLDREPRHAGALYQLALVYKNGYNDPKTAEKYLRTLLADAKSQDLYAKERAQAVLRAMKGEASREERTALAQGESAPTSGGDAELLMSSSDFEDDSGN